MKKRWWLAAAFAPAILLFSSPAALAAEEDGRIDHVESVDGQVQVLYSVPGLAESQSPDLGSVAVTVNGSTVPAKAESVESASVEVKRTSVLALDVSNSMEGERFDAAKEAARSFIKSAPDDVYIGLVTFASEVETNVTPTQDREALLEAIDALTLTADTKLYEGVLQAVEVAGSEGVGTVLLLSDGKNTDPSTKLSDVTAELEKDDVRVDVVGLDQSVSAGTPLYEIAAASGGGTAEATDPAQLEALFAGQATDLAKQILVTFPRPAGIEGDAALVVSVVAGQDTYVDEGVLPPPAASPTGPTYVPSSGFSLSVPWLLGGLALLFVGVAALLAVGMTSAGRRELTPLQKQLQLYTVHGVDTHKARRGRPQGSDVPGLKETAVAMADHFVKGQDFEQKLANKLDRAGFKLTASEWILLHIGAALVAPIFGLLLTGGNIPVTLLFFLFGAAFPWMYLSMKESRRIKKFNGQLAETLQIIAGALKAGLSLPQAIDTVVKEGAEPIASEFRRAIIEQRLGVQIEDTLDTVAERMDSMDFKWVVMAIRIQREIGGNLAELLLTVAATLREREYLRRQVQVLSAEGRMSAWILGGLPVAFFGYLALMRPEYLEPMLTSQLGWVMMGAAVVMLIVGAFWLKKMVKVEV
jgi:tight adherence protein B